MTTKAAFSPEECKMVLEGPPTAGTIVVTAAHGGTFRETIAMAIRRHPGWQGRAAHREHGQAVSPAEAEAIQQITEALGTSDS